MSLEDLNKEQQRGIADAIAKSYRHAVRVGKREHIKANRQERVDLFVVSLRRELGYMTSKIAGLERKTLINDLCSKSIWYDAGKLTSEAFPLGLSCRRSLIEPLVEMSRRQVETTDVQCDIILDGISEMESLVRSMNITADDAERINNESEEVIEQLAGVFD